MWHHATSLQLDHHRQVSDFGELWLDVMHRGLLCLMKLAKYCGDWSNMWKRRCDWINYIDYMLLNKKNLQGLICVNDPDITNSYWNIIFICFNIYLYIFSYTLKHFCIEFFAKTGLENAQNWINTDGHKWFYIKTKSFNE